MKPAEFEEEVVQRLNKITCGVDIMYRALIKTTAESRSCNTYNHSITLNTIQDEIRALFALAEDRIQRRQLREIANYGT